MAAYFFSGASPQPFSQIGIVIGFITLKYVRSSFHIQYCWSFVHLRSPTVHHEVCPVHIGGEAAGQEPRDPGDFLWIPGSLQRNSLFTSLNNLVSDREHSTLRGVGSGVAYFLGLQRRWGKLSRHASHIHLRMAPFVRTR